MVVQQAHWTKTTGWILPQEEWFWPSESVPHDAVGPPSLAQRGGVPSLFCDSPASTANRKIGQKCSAINEASDQVHKYSIYNNLH